MKDILNSSATNLAAMIKARQVTSTELVDAYIQRIQAVNPRLNAVVATRYQLARQEAADADKATQESKPEKLPPLHGVPCTIKEAFGLIGMPNTSGLVSRKGTIAKTDATAVARLRGAGAIPLGVTNISELCMWMESHNRVYGRTNNPYDQSRTAGGSSGGEGSIVGSGASPFGLGSDIGGSIRMPAFFNGVFGHKPTGGLVPGTGQFPDAENEARRYLTTGPLTRHSEDLMPLLRIIAGPDGVDGECRPFELGDPDAVDISSLNVINVPTNGAIRVDSDLRHAQREAASTLRARGANVRSDRFPALKNSLFIWSAMLSAAEDSSYRSRLGQGEPVSALKELLKWTLRRSQHTLPSIGLALIEQVPEKLPSTMNQKYIEAGAALRQELIDVMGDNGVILFPSYASPAPKHRKALWPPIKWMYTAIFNVLEFPVTQVPLGLNNQGVPLGVQVVGAPGNDHITIAVAKALESDMGGGVPPRY